MTIFPDSRDTRQDHPYKLLRRVFKLLRTPNSESVLRETTMTDTPPSISAMTYAERFQQQLDGQAGLDAEAVAGQVRDNAAIAEASRAVAISPDPALEAMLNEHLRLTFD